MLTILLLAGLAADPGESATIGQVTATAGPVTIRRGDRTYRAEVRSALRAGDRLETRSGGGAGLFLYEGSAVYLGPATLARVQGGRALGLERGEVRVAGDGDPTRIDGPG